MHFQVNRILVQRGDNKKHIKMLSFFSMDQMCLDYYSPKCGCNKIFEN